MKRQTIPKRAWIGQPAGYVSDTSSAAAAAINMEAKVNLLTINYCTSMSSSRSNHEKANKHWLHQICGRKLLSFDELAKKYCDTLTANFTWRFGRHLSKKSKILSRSWRRWQIHFSVCSQQRQPTELLLLLLCLHHHRILEELQLGACCSLLVHEQSSYCSCFARDLSH